MVKAINSVNYCEMPKHFRFFPALIVCLCVALLAGTASASAYNAHPKLVVVIVIDQFRGDYLDRGHDSFVPNGFRLFTDKGAWFSNCNYNYANTRTAPGHATLFTGAYSNGHGIFNNEYWSDSLRRSVTAVEDDNYTIVGLDGDLTGSSPHNLLSSTIGDELRLATDGKSRVFGISLKDRSSVLPAGFSGTAFWIDKLKGNWVTSTYYMKELPGWVQAFNKAGHADKYWNRSWKLEEKELRNTNKPAEITDKENFYEIVGATPFANDYEFEFARELIEQEKLGQGDTTDFLAISLSANDILGHKVGPNSDESRTMVAELDRQLADFFSYIGTKVGLGNVWFALSADHGVAPAPSYVSDLHIPGAYLGQEQLRITLNNQLRAKLRKPGATPTKAVASSSAATGPEFVPRMDWPIIMLDEKAFRNVNVSEADAEKMVADFFKSYSRGSYTRVQLMAGQVPPNAMGQSYANSLSPKAGWFVYMTSLPFFVGGTGGTDHAMPYSYDMHVPLAFYGLPFQPGVYRGACEPVDMAVTLANLLGINSPSAAVGRVLSEALRPTPATTTEAGR
jgi:predicted AlkP superfamily pyrophosphatase or phosphodiesterase